MEYTNRLYVILHPNHALIGSQLTPDQFARHYTSGSAKHHSGKVIFASIDPTFRNDYFPIDEAMKDVVPHEDGRPKATKFISTYRVLEHVDQEAIDRLYLATQEGYSIELAPGEWEDPYEEGFVRIYAEINPMRMLALSDYDLVGFGKFITWEGNFKSAPRQFYTQLDIDIIELLEEFEQNPFRQSPIQNLHLSTLRDAFYEVKRYTGKHTKGLCLDSSLDNISYRFIRHGFMIATFEKQRFFVMPSLSEIEKNHFKFFRSM